MVVLSYRFLLGLCFCSYKRSRKLLYTIRADECATPLRGWGGCSRRVVLPKKFDFCNASFIVLFWPCHSRECGLPLLRHLIDSENVGSGAGHARLLKLLLDLTLFSSRSSPVAAQEASSETPSKTQNKHGKDKSNALSEASQQQTTRVFATEEAEELFHRTLCVPGQAQLLALRALSSVVPPRAVDGDSATEFHAGDGMVLQQQRRRLILAVVKVGLGGADGSLVAAAARALPAMPGDLAAVIVDLVPSVAGRGAEVAGNKVSGVGIGFVGCGALLMVLLAALYAL